MMTQRHIVRAFLAESYDYGYVALDIPPAQANFIIDWGNLHVPDEALFLGDDGDMGREDEMHVTVKYGLVAQDVPKELYFIADDTRPFPVKLGRTSLFENDDFDVLKLEVESEGLMRLNQRIAKLPNEDSYPTYQPHCTIAYLQKGAGADLVGQDIFAEHGAPSAAFMAYGMTYRGSTPEDGSEEPREIFLFSKAKSPAASAMQAQLAKMESHSPFDGLPFPSDAKELIRFFREKNEKPTKILS